MLFDVYCQRGTSWLDQLRVFYQVAKLNYMTWHVHSRGSDGNFLIFIEKQILIKGKTMS